MNKLSTQLNLDPDFVGTFQKLLAESYGLMVKAQKYHWDVTGPSFGPLHSLFQEEYEYFFGVIDDCAERIRQYGGFPKSNLKTIASMCSCEVADEPLDCCTQVKDFFDSLTKYIEEIRDLINTFNNLRDHATVNWLSGVIQDLEKQAWKFRAILEDMPENEEEEDDSSEEFVQIR